MRVSLDNLNGKLRENLDPDNIYNSMNLARANTQFMRKNKIPFL